MTSLLAALAASSLADEIGRKSDRRSNPEALCMTLREVATRYVEPCPFGHGQIVTPRCDSDMKGKGEPHVVLEVIPRPDPDFRLTEPRHSASNVYGARRDMRVACEGPHGSVVKFWVESNEFEPYSGPGSEPAQQAA